MSPPLAFKKVSAAFTSDALVGIWGIEENRKTSSFVSHSHQPPLPRQVRRPPSYKVSLRQPPLIVGCNVFRITGAETIIEYLNYLKDTSGTC